MMRPDICGPDLPADSTLSAGPPVADWPAVSPLESEAHVQAFPADVLPEPLRRFVEETARSLAVPADNPRGVLLAEDELTAWTTAVSRRGADRQRFLSIWSSAAVEVDRRSRRGRETLFLPQPFVAVVGNLPPRQVARLTRHREE